ncbi:MAG: hypothetical protein KJ749_07520 [Planctomycetes bacterium]|nr:hypothetical protein [Planctomycetota bacterium]
MSVTLESVYSLLGQSFDYLLILDDKGEIAHISNDLAKEALGDTAGGLRATRADEVFNGASLDIIRSTMNKLEQNDGPELIVWETRPGRPSILLKAVMKTTESGRLFMFWGSRFTALENLTYKEDWKRIQQAKELACIYAVAEWVEA